MPNLVDHLAFRARLAPADPAIHTVDRTIGMAELHRLVQAAALRLRDAGVRPGDRVVTQFADRSLEWVATLALLHEAAVGVAVHHEQSPDLAGLCAWRLTDTAAVPPSALPTIALDAGWLEPDPALRAAQAVRYAGPDALVRIAQTSGTTGRPHSVPLSHAIVLDRARVNLSWADDPARILGLYGLTGSHGFHLAVAALIAGAPRILGSTPAECLALAARHGCRVLKGSPFQIAGLIDEIERSGRAPPPFEWVQLGGSSLSTALRERVDRVLGARILAMYGSTEVSRVAFCEVTADTPPGLAGAVVPGASVQIVDADGRPLPPGAEGAIRVRTETMVHGYLDEDDASSAAFRDGWFHPGDLGALTPDGLLRITGRSREIINLGGIKFDPERIDRFLEGLPGVQAAGTFAVEGAAGVDDVAAALVVAPGADLGAIARRLAAEFGIESPSRLFRVDDLPRTPLGKIRREELRARLGGAAADLDARRGPPRRG